MKPMEKNSTRFIKYHEISITETDIFDDAMGLSVQFQDVLDVLGKVNISPARKVNSRLMECLRNEMSKY
jgi:hypothetical protein